MKKDKINESASCRSRNENAQKTNYDTRDRETVRVEFRDDRGRGGEGGRGVGEARLIRKLVVVLRGRVTGYRTGTLPQLTCFGALIAAAQVFPPVR